MDTREHFYSSCWLQRCEERRSDADWLAARRADPSTRFVPVWRQRNLVCSGETVRAILPTTADLGRVPSVDETFFLGTNGEGAALFGLCAPDEDAAAELSTPEFHQFVSLRRVGAALGTRDAGVLAFARALAYWHDANRFCGACGASTTPRRAGWLRVCTREVCAREHFPRTDPAVIMRVEHGHRVLLGRQAAWPARWYSVLAGFVEPGESLEQAVRREVAEEAGLTVDDVRYDSSQPWPFPASLMAGFSAVARDDQIRLASDELEDARWFSRRDIRQEVAAGRLRLSPPQSISRVLLDTWLGEAAIPPGPD